MFEVDTQSLLRVLSVVESEKKKRLNSADDPVISFQSQHGNLRINYFNGSYGFEVQLPVESGDALTEFMLFPDVANAYFSIKKKGTSIVSVSEGSVEICQVEGDGVGASHVTVRTPPFRDIGAFFGGDTGSTATLDEAEFREALSLAIRCPENTDTVRTSSCINLTILEDSLQVCAGRGTFAFLTPVKGRTDINPVRSLAWIHRPVAVALLGFLKKSGSIKGDVIVVQTGEKSVRFSNSLGTFYARTTALHDPAPNLKLAMTANAQRAGEPAIVEIPKNQLIPATKASYKSAEVEVKSRSESDSKPIIKSSVAIQLTPNPEVVVLHYGQRDSVSRISVEVPAVVTQPEGQHISYFCLQVEQVKGILSSINSDTIIFRARKMPSHLEVSYPGQPDGEIIMIACTDDSYYAELLKNA